MIGRGLDRAKRGVRTALALAGLQRMRAEPDRVYPEISDADQALLDRIRPFTMTSRARQYNLLKAVRYVDALGIPGDIVECGVWRGGNIMLAKMGRQQASVARRYVLFDTFAGMTAPTDYDVFVDGQHARSQFDASARDGYNEWCYASLEDVRKNLADMGFRDDEVVFVKGDVLQTLSSPDNLPEQIAILRLDTDWYESTKAELEALYPRLSKSGVLIIDDYGVWEGARRAVDEYFGSTPPLLVGVDHTGRFAIKV